MPSTTEETQKELQNSEKTKNEQIMKMFCSDIKEINASLKLILKYHLDNFLLYF